MALALVRKLYKVAGGGILEWGAVDLIVHRRDHVDALEYAVEHGWIAVGPGRQSVTLTNAGRRLATAKG